MNKYRKIIVCLSVVVFCFLSNYTTMIVTLKCCKENVLNKEQQNIVGKDQILFDLDIMSNKELTQDYADLIFSSILNENNDEYSKSIKFDDVRKVWIVSYLPLDDEILGGSIDILISAKNGEVINIVYGE